MGKMPTRAKLTDAAGFLSRLWTNYLVKVEDIETVAAASEAEQQVSGVSLTEQKNEDHSLTINQYTETDEYHGGINQYFDYDEQTNINTGGLANRLRAIRITSADSPYQAKFDDHVIFCDTDGGAIEVDMTPGYDGQELITINVGSSGNNVTVDPYNTEQIRAGGAGVAVTVADGVKDSFNFNSIEGWW